MNWLRLWIELYKDKKIRNLPVEQRWLWVVILMLARESEQPGRLVKYGDVPMTIVDFAQAAGISNAAANAGVAAFQRSSMMHKDGEVFVVTHWKKRQPDSDNVAVRVQKHRDKQRGVTLQETYLNTPLHVTAPEAEAESEADSETEEPAAAARGTFPRMVQSWEDDQPNGAVDTCGIPFEQYNTLRKAFSHEEIASAKAEVESRSTFRGTHNWDRYLIGPINDARRLAERPAVKPIVPNSKATQAAASVFRKGQ